MKPGYKTTEFWLSLAATILGALMAGGVLSDDSTAGKIAGAVLAALAAAGYSASRGIAKSNELSR